MDYRTYAAKFTYNILRRNLKSININVTDRCNSKCKTCYIWKKTPNTDLSLDVMENLLNDKIINKKIVFGLTGGEFLLHPKYNEILELFDGYDYLFFSNGIMADRLIETVKKYNIKHLFMSADGIGDTYKKIRGVDTFKNIRKIVSDIKDITNITIDFTISPFNQKKDLVDVVNFCEENNINIAVGVYNQPEFFDTDTKPKKAFEFDDIKAKCFYFHPAANNRFIKYYNKWLDGEMKLNCYSIRSLLSILPDGDVSLCQGKNIILGNLYKTSLSDIWNSEETIKTQKKNKHCNGCFLSCQRPVDIAIDKSPLKWIIR